VDFSKNHQTDQNNLVMILWVSPSFPHRRALKTSVALLFWGIFCWRSRGSSKKRAAAILEFISKMVHFSVATPVTCLLIACFSLSQISLVCLVKNELRFVFLCHCRYERCGLTAALGKSE